MSQETIEGWVLNDYNYDGRAPDAFLDSPREVMLEANGAGIAVIMFVKGSPLTFTMPARVLEKLLVMRARDLGRSKGK